MRIGNDNDNKQYLVVTREQMLKGYFVKSGNLIYRHDYVKVRRISRDTFLVIAPKIICRKETYNADQ